MWPMVVAWQWSRRLKHFTLKADDEPWWIVLFSPSAAGHVMPALRKHFSMTEGKSSPSPGEAGHDGWWWETETETRRTFHHVTG
jgi:hypothetical protein